MTLLPQVEQALVEGAGRYYRRPRRAARMVHRAAPILAAAAVIATVAGLVAGRSGETEREAKPAAPGMLAMAEAAGCTLGHPPIEGNAHAAHTFTIDDYATDPPTSGDHAPEPAADGVYDRGSTPGLGSLVHALEHGRINIQYRENAPREVVARLEELVAENGGYHTLLFAHTTAMDGAEIAATAWGHSLTCQNAAPDALDAIRAFRDRYVDQGPERVP